MFGIRLKLDGIFTQAILNFIACGTTTSGTRASPKPGK